MQSPVHGIQPTFAGGEFTPALYSRVDLAKYSTGLKKARNVNILPQGGVRNRPGMYFCGAAGDSTNPVRLIPFVYATGQSYILEFGEEYIRFYTNDAQILASSTVSAWATSTRYSKGDFVTNSGHTYYCLITHTSGTFATDLTNGKWRLQTVYEVPSPYTGDELFDLKFTQSADYLYIFHKDHAPQQLIRYANDSWAISAFPFQRGPFMLSNTIVSRTLTPSAKTQTSGTPVNINSVSVNGSSDTFWTPVLNITTTGMVTGDTVLISSLTGAAASYLNNNTFTIEVHTYCIKLYYLNTTELVKVPYYDGYVPGGGTVTPYSKITLTSNFDLFDALHVGAYFEITHTIPAQNIIDSSFSTGAHTSSSIRCGPTWRVITSGTSWAGSVTLQMSVDNGTTWNTLRVITGDNLNNIDTSGDTGVSQCLIRATSAGLTSGTVTINLSSDTFDWVAVLQITSVTNSKTALANIMSFSNIGIGLGSTDATYQWAEGSWSDYRGWPSVATFFQDRLCIASTVSEPQTIWMSQTGDYTNFGVSSPIVDSDAISAVLPSRTINIVKSLNPLSSLVVLTSDSDFGISVGNNGVLSPTSIDITCHGHRGTADTPPVLAGNELILVQQMGTVIRNLIYQFVVNGYMGDDIGIVSKHLLTGHSIVEMAYQQEPDSIIWAVRDDGVLLSLTYMREQEVIAWSWHDTDGVVESVAVIPNQTLGINEVWLVVKRTIGGVPLRYIERFAPRDMGDDAEDYMMLDSAITYDSTATTTITGLSHLNGKTVNALADGNVVTGLTVAAGSVTLPVAASLVHVGLPYISDVETLRIEMSDQTGTAQGRKIAIPRVTVRFWNSRGGHIGITSQDSTAIADTGVVGLDEIPQRGPEDNLNAPIPLKTQDYLFTPNGGYDFGTSIFFRQTDPLPFCILAFIPQIVKADN